MGRNQTKHQVIDHLLGLISNSKWNWHLVLRGKLVHKAWLGDKVCEPDNIDWIFRPKKIGIDDPLALELLLI